MVDLTGTNDVPQSSTAVAMGLFDGLHYGHRTVIRRAADVAAENPGIEPAVFTFDTASVTSKGDGGVEYILSREMKFELIEHLGVRYVYSPDFMNFKDLTGEEFVELVLCGKLNARFVTCGEDFRFGRQAKCGVDELDRLCRKHGIGLYVVPPVRQKQGARISSTMIRELIRSGDIEQANLLLGNHFTMKLPVVYGNRLGRELNFPTINQYLPKRQVMPRFGVYASKTELPGQIYKSVTNIGVKPTVGSAAPLAETHIIGFDGSDLYGEIAKISLISFIRPEMKFDNVNDLKAQIGRDVRAALEVPEEKYKNIRNLREEN
ncbi:MAG: riboflavin biosynthesis protein RibF [Ruminococcus sp.]|nr:riboflavin biosynthesis protein RibF [Ruminococcus sp.]MCM1380667.1 riboflavin biosynthesis protein RibF [Muribaculaceae bacterium]MCM1478463.1 riboflavin biosynthesis protein RibF [Muribaculaceae bacterium]